MQALQKAGASTAELGLTLTACQGVLGWIARRGMWREASRLISVMEKGQATVQDFAGTMASVLLADVLPIFCTPPPEIGTGFAVPGRFEF
jgi:hypothetical protein